MHVADIGLNILGANGIVGASMGLGIGAALAVEAARLRTSRRRLLRRRRRQRGHLPRGPEHGGDLEAAGRLPVREQPVRPVDLLRGGDGWRFHRRPRAAGYGVPGDTIDGNDVVAVYAAVDEAIARARAGEGPSLIEAITYRRGDHSHARQSARATAERRRSSAGRRCDPIARCAGMMKDRGALTDSELAEMVAEAEAELDVAVAFANGVAEPDVAMMLPAVLAPPNSSQCHRAGPPARAS